MPSLPRFYLDPDEWRESELILTGGEAHHCVDVLRLQPGNRVVVFDGRGTEAMSEIVEAGKNRVTLRPGQITRTDPPSARIILGQAIPKGKNMDLIIQKATELGVSEIYPVVSERTIVRLDEGEADSRRKKWARVALEAGKQSGQNWVPEVHTPAPLSPRLFDEVRRQVDFLIIASLEADSRHLEDILAEYREMHDDAMPGGVFVLIGPEGDFTPAEFSLAKREGCLPMTLGPIVLRTETAALYSISVLGYKLFNAS